MFEVAWLYHPPSKFKSACDWHYQILLRWSLLFARYPPTLSSPDLRIHPVLSVAVSRPKTNFVSALTSFALTWFWMKVIASCMNWTAACLCTPMVNMPMTAEGRVSYRQKVEPDLFSISKEIDSSLHMWNSVLYWILPKPGWWRKLQNIKPRGSVNVVVRITDPGWFRSTASLS